MPGLLITGTDTGVGKTVVACTLVAELVRRGWSVAVWKPVETGWDASAEYATDAAQLRRAAASTESLESICPVRLRAPLAPSVAAALESRTIDLTHLRRLYTARAGAVDLTIVEGAGGLLVPLDGQTTYLELAQTLGLALLIVAANRLGVVNHVALTARVAETAGLHVVGFVLNHPAHGTDASTATNRATITTLTGLTCYGTIPFEPAVLDAPERGAAHIDIGGILERLSPSACGSR